VRIEYSVVLYQATRYDEALQQLELAIKATTNNEALASLHEARSNIYLAKRDFNAAVAAIDDQLANVVSQDERKGLRLAQARLEVSLGNWNEAAARFDAAVTEVPPDHDEKRREIMLEKAQALATHNV